MPYPFAVIFDNDGVLVDSEPFSEHAYRTALAEQGAIMDWSDGSRYCGLTDADILKDVSERCGIALDGALLNLRKWELYQEAAIRNAMRAFPGATALLESLQSSSIACA